MIKLARRSIFKTVFDKQNPRKKLMFFDLVDSYKAGLDNLPEEQLSDDDKDDS